MFKDEFINDSVSVYEMKFVEKISFYRIVGIDLVYEIENEKVLFLQILGTD